MTRVILVRHGNSEANQIGFWAGQVDVELTSVGVAQAKKTAKYVTDKYHIDAIYASTLKRAWQTAEEIGKIIGKPVIRDKRFCEIYGGIWDGMMYKDIKDRYPQAFELWNNDMSKVSPPNGETVAQVQKRAFEALKDICEANSDKTIVIVAHRVVLRSLQCMWENLPIDKINECGWLGNCSVSEIKFDFDKLTPIEVNQTEFLGDISTGVSTIM